MKDFVLGDDFDLVCKNGDFAIGESAQQEAELIILSQKGEWKQNPLIGLGIENHINSRAGGSPTIDNVTRFERDLKVALAADGKDSATLDITGFLTAFNLSV